MTASEISSWKELQDCYRELSLEKGRRWLFRGHLYAFWRLRSALERAVRTRFQEPYSRMRWFEGRLTREFQRHFHRYADTRIDDADLLRWLAIMQHHGAPTRLLDWSYSFLVAVYFAAEHARPGIHGAVWALDLGWCWTRADQFVEKAILDRFRADDKDLEATATVLATDRPGVLPLNPFSLDQRLAGQQGVFLAPLDLRVSFMANLFALGGVSDLRTNLRKIKLRWTRDFLIETLSELHNVNINRRSLFPDLDGLAAGLENMIAMPHLFRLHGDRGGAV